MKFLYFDNITQKILELGIGQVGADGGVVTKVTSFLSIFLDSGINILLLLVAAGFYGLIKETFDVTTLSYILNNTSPSDYSKNISKYNIHGGIGSMVGLIFSGVLLSFNIKIALVIFMVIIFCFLFLLLKYFDNIKETIEFKDIAKIKHLKLDVIKTTLQSTKDNVIKSINVKNVIELSKQTKVILLKPIELKNSIDFGDVFKTTKEDMGRFVQIMFASPRNLILFWIFFIIMQYGFRDTFVATFQIDFLTKIIDLNKDNLFISQTHGLVSGYVLLGVLVIPAFVFQDFFINLCKKIGVFKVILIGSIISSCSLLMFGFIDKLGLVMLFGLLNSVGYAAVMPTAQGVFSSKYNEIYASKNNLSQIDATVSAAPLKMVLNMANVVGLVLGGVFVGVLGFNGFFIFFSIVLLGLTGYSMMKSKEFSKIEMADEEPVNIPEEEKVEEKVVESNNTKKDDFMNEDF